MQFVGKGNIQGKSYQCLEQKKLVEFEKVLSTGNWESWKIRLLWVGRRVHMRKHLNSTSRYSTDWREGQMGGFCWCLYLLVFLIFDVESDNECGTIGYQEKAFKLDKRAQAIEKWGLLPNRGGKGSKKIKAPLLLTKTPNLEQNSGAREVW